MQIESTSIDQSIIRIKVVLILMYFKRLVLAGRSQEKLTEVKELCVKRGCEKCVIFPLDVAIQDECR